MTALLAALAPLGDDDTQAYLAGVVQDWASELRARSEATVLALVELLGPFLELEKPRLTEACAAVLRALGAEGMLARLPEVAQPSFEETFVPEACEISCVTVPSLGPAEDTVLVSPAAAIAPPVTLLHLNVSAHEAEQAWAATLDDTDDYATAWAECLATGRTWGGRGFGGRGIARQYQRMSHAMRDVSIDGITMAFGGHALLTRTTLRLTHGRRYALLGKNGVGKSTLLRRIAAGRLPGFPPHLKVQYMVQDLPLTALAASAGPAMSAIDYLVQGACAHQRSELIFEKKALELLLSPLLDDTGASISSLTSVDSIDTAAVAERLGEIEAALADIEDDTRARHCAVSMLSGLGFSPQRMNDAVTILSGGWRVRLALAASLLSKPDVLLLDEPSSHLDLHAVLWLERYLTHEMSGRGVSDGGSTPVMSHAATLLFVSHDRSFVSAVATDIIVFENKQLRAFHGTFMQFEEKEREQALAHSHRLNARVRQEVAARHSAEKMQAAAKGKSKGSGDNLLRAAKQKLAKVERIGLYREDGKAFHLQSMKTMAEDALRLPERVEAHRAAREDAFSFPAPDWTGVRGGAGVLLSLDSVTCGYPGCLAVVTGMTAHVSRNAKIAIVGPNGRGKSTLMKLLLGDPSVQCQSGNLGRAQNLRVAYAPQHHAEALAAHAGETATAHCASRFQCSELDARARLGKFGLKGDAAVRPLGLLSGGQRVRVSLAILTWHAPHILLLDEPTNSLDGFALDALAAALLAFEGAVLLVSHNRAFTTAVCSDLWIVDDGLLVTHHSESAGGATPSANSFGTLFADYAASVTQRSGAYVEARQRATTRMASALDKAAEANRRATGRSKAPAGLRTALL